MNKNSPLVVSAYLTSFFLMLTSQNWFFLWMSLELNTFSFISVLALYKKYKKNLLILFFVSQVLSSLFLVLAMFLTENKICLNQSLSTLLLASMLLKMGSVPMHHWSINVAIDMPPLLLIAFMSIQKLLPFYLLKNFLHMSFLFIFLWFFLNILWGSTQNFNQTKMKIILIMSSLSHLGWLLLSTMNLVTWEMYFVFYTFVLTTVLPLTSLNTQKMNSMNKNFYFMIIFLTLGGLPPFLGFFPKLYIFFISLEHSFLMCMALIILLSLLDLFIYTRMSAMNLTKTKKKLTWLMSPQWKPLLLMFINLSVMFLLVV